MLETMLPDEVVLVKADGTRAGRLKASVQPPLVVLADIGTRIDVGDTLLRQLSSGTEESFLVESVDHFSAVQQGLTGHFELRVRRNQSNASLPNKKTADMKKGRKKKRRFGDWDVIEGPFSGGNANVYKVIHSQTAEVAALKQLYRTSEESLARFDREYRVLKSLPHNVNVVRLLDAQPEMEVKKPWFVMEWIEGQNLREQRERFVGDLMASLDTIISLSSAAAFLHGHGVFHRDIKPDNALVESTGRLVLADLGLCWFDDGEEERLTADDRPAGAWGFRAPEYEHSRVEDVESSADVFSIVKILWWLIHGGEPFPAAHYQAPEFDLAEKYGDVRMHGITTLMSKVITPGPEQRQIRNGADLRSELQKYKSMLESPAKGRVGLAFVEGIARKHQGEASRTKVYNKSVKIGKLYPNTKEKWLEALRPLIEEVVAAVKDTDEKLPIEVINQLPDARGKLPEAIGFGVRGYQVAIVFETAVDSGDLTTKTLWSIKIEARVNGQDISNRLGLPGLKLTPQLVGEEVCFFYTGKEDSMPIDPSEFWGTCLEVVAGFLFGKPR